MKYFPHTEGDITKMLERIGVGSLDELYSDIPSECIYKGEYDLPSAMSELEIRRYFDNMAAKNVPLKVFAGCGAYDHYCPAVIPFITSRSEYLTAYTPYQAEVSQGTLRYIFEWQSMICRLTGMDVANASMYDGATAAAEAMFMTLSCTKKKSRVLLSDGILPQVRRVVETYAKFHGVPLTLIPLCAGETSHEAVAKELSKGDVAGLIVPSINRYGIIEDLSGLSDALHQGGAVLSVYADPSALAVVKTPAEWGADICCGDAQSLGMPLCFGGPYAGFLSCKSAYVRRLPGRLVGQATDADGKRGYVLTLQAREQHIRRDKATSNICSNQSLMALYATVYLSLMGPNGLRKVNEISSCGAHYLKARLLETGLFAEAFDKPFLKEFVLKPRVSAEKIQKTLLDAGFFAALSDREGYVSFCVTEKHTKAECDALVAALEPLKK